MRVTLLKYFCIFSAIVRGTAVEADADFERQKSSRSPQSSMIVSYGSCEVGWEKYEDEKCIKISDHIPEQRLDYAGAKTLCKRYEARLVSIGSQKKQSFLEQYLRSKKVSGNVWIGLEQKKYQADYQWSDGTRFKYTNWAPGSPKYQSDHCVQIQVDNDKFGKWSDVLCTVKNVVLCERIQLWSPYRLQEAARKLSTQQMVPVGFIFFQLPKQIPPAQIWPSVTWKDVTAEYAGFFFRALGRGSAYFDSVQKYNAPTLTEVRGKAQNKGLLFNETRLHTNLSHGSSSPWIFVGDEAVASNWYQTLSFCHQEGEVRPRNMAIRVWKRV